jgi:hypothetical protein
MFNPHNVDTWPVEGSQVEVLWHMGYRQPKQEFMTIVQNNTLAFHIPLEVAREVMVFEKRDFNPTIAELASRSLSGTIENLTFRSWLTDVIAWRYADKLPRHISEHLTSLGYVDHIMTYKEYNDELRRRHMIHEGEDPDGMAYRLHRYSRSVPLLELLRPQVRRGLILDPSTPRCEAVG